MEKQSFWQSIPKPVWILAPMEGVTDTVFRQMVASLGKPSVFYTEFTNVAGMCSAGAGPVEERLWYTEDERPVVAQLWGVEPRHFFQAAGRVVELGFDGIDINFGCPVRDVVKWGACAAMIGNYSQVGEIIQATREGARGLPISVKTRIGTKEIITEKWIGFLLKQKLAAITIHGRTAAEMSTVPAHWDEIGKAVDLRNVVKSSSLVVGNGDVRSLDEAIEKVAKWGVDGVMIGRGVLENPWVFAGRDGGKADRLAAFFEHIQLWKSTWGGNHHAAGLKKFAKAYVRNWEGASELRMEIMETTTLVEMEQILMRES